MSITKHNVVVLHQTGDTEEFEYNMSIFDKRNNWDVIVTDTTLSQYSVMGDINIDQFIIHRHGRINDRHIDQWESGSSKFAQSKNILCGRNEYCAEFYGHYETYDNDITGDEFYSKHIEHHIFPYCDVMHDNVISYTVFGEENPRYTANIHELMTVNSIVYPNYDVVVYIDDKIRNSSTYNMLKTLQNNGMLYIIDVDKKYNDDKLILTAYRMKEVWNTCNNVVAIRDIDSIPNSFEVKTTLFFENSAYSLSTIRSRETHWWSGHVLYLAGLSNFKPSRIRNLTDRLSFDEYLSNYEYVWDGDQRLLRKYFGNDNDRAYLCDNFIDFAHYKATVFKYKDIDSMVEISIDDSVIDIELLQVLDNITVWAGEPISDASILTKYINTNNCPTLKGSL